MLNATAQRPRTLDATLLHYATRRFVEDGTAIAIAAGLQWPATENRAANRIGTLAARNIQNDSNDVRNEEHDFFAPTTHLCTPYVRLTPDVTA